ncbi:sulfur carrier protein [Sinobacterium caligoides]|uniref:Sulfur carrier protein n=2 Tax=Sinobacterium caligoides TaxID=933926 RepID=A0A3N2DP78_9GAMM|nr:sulfur carrier protein [Sinobacterium caligoides]
MVEIFVNGERKLIDSGIDIGQALLAWGYDTAHKIAVAVNGEFVPRSLYGQRVLIADDRVDVVSPISGG